ncbi:DUF2892 domain-containing protein [Cupriavidus sp. 2SB]|uniref:YgaP family membrane protein n=1 Tax=Cupriavidus sp. 2SB TaxID=2502199 RepID=UPI0010F87744|nr:DUF2892 domain-containing protein [Cupriavidus sp. 2SB]
MFYVKNVPGWERAVRVVVGLVVAIAAIIGMGGLWGTLIAVCAAGIVVSGLVGFCPMCAMVGRRLDRQQGKR